MVTKNGFPLTYTVTKASIHDVNMAETLALECPIAKLLGDKGYISSTMQERLLDKGIELSTPLRKNSKNSKKIDDSLLSEHRKVIETVVSSWENLGIQNFKSRSTMDTRFCNWRNSELLIAIFQALQVEPDFETISKSTPT